MDKRVRKIAAATMLFTAFSIVDVNGNVLFENNKAYAASSKLTDLSMGNVELYENSNYTKELDNGKSLKKEYYAKISSDRSKVSINTSADSDCVRISKSKGKKYYEQGDDIPVFSGQTTLYVQVYDNKEDRDNDKNCVQQYKIYLKRYTKEEEEEIKNDDQEEVYLQTLELDYGDIPLGFTPKKMKYDVSVDNDVNTLAIKAVPDDGAYTARVNGISLKKEDDYKKMITLSKGTTEVKVTLTFDDEDKVVRTYTINITKKDKDEQKSEEKTESVSENNNASADAANTNKNEASNNESNTASTSNGEGNTLSESENKTGWNKLNDKWTYRDDYGNQLKNAWFYDRTYGRTYYFDNDGYMKTGWLQLGSDWYYLNSDGAMETGWKNINNKWYYLNYDGKMKTGWFKDSDGKYYYLNPSGEMALNTTVNGYRLGKDGAWIK